MRDSPFYRDNLEELKTSFPGREAISMNEAAAFLGVSRKRLRSDDTFPHRTLGGQEIVPLPSMARWLSK